MNSEIFASVMPNPVKKLCERNPVPYCSLGSLSAMNARYGSIAVLFAASSIHNNPAAIHNELLKGYTNKHKLQSNAPIKKKGFLLPNLGCHVWSLNAPMIG